MKMTTIHLGRRECGREEKMIRGERGLNGEGAAERGRSVYLYIHICACEGENGVCLCTVLCPESAATAEREWDLCSKQPAGYLKALGPALD